MFGIKEIDATGLKQMMDDGEDIQLYDVRSQAEFAQGIIKGGEFMPMHTVPLKMNDLPKDKKIIFLLQKWRSFRSGVWLCCSKFRHRSS